MAEVTLVGGGSSTLDQAAQTSRGVLSSEPACTWRWCPQPPCHLFSLEAQLELWQAACPAAAGPYPRVSGSLWCHQAPGLHPHSTPTCPAPPPGCAGLLPSQPWLLVSQVEMKINSSEGSFNFLYLSENKCAFPTTQPCKFPAL